MKHWKGYEHGINLGGWFSQCDHTKERYDRFIREPDIEKISSWGLDHLRLPVDYDLVEDENGSYKEEGFAYIEKAVSWCGKYGLNMVLDLHKTYGYSFDDGEGESGFFENEGYQERFYRLWEQFARRFGGLGERIAFELLNEVTKKEYCDAWNRIASNCIDRIRNISPDVKILIGGYYNNSIEALPDLLPPKDENIIYNFHCYEPLIFTHQGAYWIPEMEPSFRMSADETYGEIREKSDRNLPGTPIDYDEYDQSEKLGCKFFEKIFSEAVGVAEERNVALYCGEYGVINLASAEDTLKWYRMIGDTFNKYGIGRAAWSYREMDFGIVDPHMDSVRDDVLKYL